MTDPRLDSQFERLRESPTPEGLAERLAAQLPSAVAPVRPLPPTWRRAAALFGLMLAVSVVLGFAAGGKGWRALDAMQRSSLVLVVGAGMIWLAFELSSRMSPSPRLFWNRLLPILLAPLAIVAWIALETPASGNSPLFYPICLAFTTAGVAATGWVTWRWLQRGFAPSRLSLFAATACGLAGFAAVEFFCPFVDAPHILTSHLLPALLAGAAVAWWMRRTSNS
jgi:hypothetical protein